MSAGAVCFIQIGEEPGGLCCCSRLVFLDTASQSEEHSNFYKRLLLSTGSESLRPTTTERRSTQQLVTFVTIQCVTCDSESLSRRIRSVRTAGLTGRHTCGGPSGQTNRLRVRPLPPAASLEPCAPVALLRQWRCSSTHRHSQVPSQRRRRSRFRHRHRPAPAPWHLRQSGGWLPCSGYPDPNQSARPVASPQRHRHLPVASRRSGHRRNRPLA